MSADLACPVCDGPLRERPASALLRISHCVRCGHSLGRHVFGGPSADYFAQYVYDRGGFIDTLRRTRLRQAQRWIAMLRACHPALRGILDVGCGHGWFLEEVRRAGLHSAGVDTSAIAVDELRARGIEAAQVYPDTPFELPPGIPSSPCDAVALLDVIEHLPPERVSETLERVAACLGPSALLLVKVPSSGGLLYRTAVALARVGVPGPIEQLYQVGTSPPHLSYFSRQSLQKTLERAGLRPVAWASDPDFEPDALGDRVQALGKLPGWLSRSAGRGLAALALAARAEDSVICVAEQRASPP